MSFKIKLNLDRTVTDFYPGLTRAEVYKISEKIAENWDYSTLIDEVKTLIDEYAKEIAINEGVKENIIAVKGNPYYDYLKGWQDAMEDITWEAENYLPGLDPETGLPVDPNTASSDLGAPVMEPDLESDGSATELPKGGEI